MTDAEAEIIAIDEHAALCLAAREVGSPLWQALVDGTSLSRLTDALFARYADEPDRLSPDIDALFEAFDERGLLSG
jgi:hypothetical protein